MIKRGCQSLGSEVEERVERKWCILLVRTRNDPLEGVEGKGLDLRDVVMY